jgi:uncharacterized protein YuzE
MRVTYDEQGDAVMIYLRDIEPGGVEYTHEVAFEGLEGDVLLDFDGDDHLIGVEVLNASVLIPPELLAEAVRL